MPLFQSLLTLGGKCPLSALLGILRFLRSSVDISAPHFLLPLLAESFSFYAFFWSCSVEVRFWWVPFCFPKGGAKAQVCGPLLVPQIWVSYPHVLIICLPKLSLATLATVRIMHRQPATEWDVCGWDAHSTEGTCQPAGRVYKWGIPRGSWGGFLLHAVNTTLMHS